jgi:hypothetical protein
MYEMTNTSEPGEAPDDPPEPLDPPSPKRGAFPTPRSKIEAAKPYIPGADEKDDPERESDLPPDDDGEVELTQD